MLLPHHSPPLNKPAKKHKRSPRSQASKSDRARDFCNHNIHAHTKHTAVDENSAESKRATDSKENLEDNNKKSQKTNKKDGGRGAFPFASHTRTTHVWLFKWHAPTDQSSEINCSTKRRTFATTPPTNPTKNEQQKDWRTFTLDTLFCTKISVQSLLSLSLARLIGRLIVHWCFWQEDSGAQAATELNGATGHQTQSCFFLVLLCFSSSRGEKERGRKRRHEKQKIGQPVSSNSHQSNSHKNKAGEQGSELID